MTVLAAAVPYLAAAATVASGVISYQSQIAASNASKQQAALALAQAEEAAQLAELQTQQATLAYNSADIAKIQESIDLRDTARKTVATSMVQGAASGYETALYGSFGAVLGDAKDELYKDLEANQLSRKYLKAQYLTEIAGYALEQASALETGQYQANAYEASAEASQWGAYASAIGTIGKTYTLF